MEKKRHLPVHDCGPRTRDESAIDAIERFFDEQEDWRELFEEIDRRDPNMAGRRRGV